MYVLRYGGRAVYTDSSSIIGNRDLARAQRLNGIISDAYFFDMKIVDGTRVAERAPFNKERIRRSLSGLLIEMQDTKGAVASVAIAGLSSIERLLLDANLKPNAIDRLKGEFVTEYCAGPRVIGFSFLL